MNVSIILPIKYLQLSNSDFHLCYASKLGDAGYLNYYREKERVLLDTSPELPRKSDTYLLGWGMKKVKSSIIVLPSVDYSATRTIEVAGSFLSNYKPKYCVGVVQGIDLDSLRLCYESIRSYCDIIGLPSPLETIARRDEIARDLHIKEKILYIEVYKNPYEEVPPSGSVGICTSYPVRLAADLRKLSEYSPTPPPLDFGKKDLIENLVKANIEEYLEVIKYAGGGP